MDQGLEEAKSTSETFKPKINKNTNFLLSFIRWSIISLKNVKNSAIYG